MPRRILIVPLLSLFLLAGSLGAARAFAQEHPEHPTDKPMTEEAKLTKDSLADAIQAWVNDQSRILGSFMVYDAVAKEPLALTLDHVHRERLASLGNDVYFACADFKAQNGKMYDIDVFMQKTEDGLKATDVSVHKVDGKARYTWAEDGGVWKKKPVE